MMREQVRCHDEAANHQLPIAAAFWICLLYTSDAADDWLVV